jgi:hypothetical protein
VAQPDLNEEINETVIPDHVLSVKALSDFKRNSVLNSTQIIPIPSNLTNAFNSPQPDPGENCEVPDQMKLNKDLLREEIEKFKKKLGDRNLTEKIVRALREVEEEVTNQAPKRNSLWKRDKSKQPTDIALGKRGRAKVTITNNVNQTDTKKSRLLKVKMEIPILKANDRVKIRTFRFGKEDAKGRSRYTYGNIVSMDGGKVIDVRWDNDEGVGEVMKTKLTDLQLVDPALKIVAPILKDTMDCGGWPLRSVEAMFPVLEVGSQLTDSDINANGNWPRDFIEALIRPD